MASFKHTGGPCYFFFFLSGLKEWKTESGVVTVIDPCSRSLAAAGSVFSPLSSVTISLSSCECHPTRNATSILELIYLLQGLFTIFKPDNSSSKAATVSPSAAKSDRRVRGLAPCLVDHFPRPHLWAWLETTLSSLADITSLFNLKGNRAANERFRATFVWSPLSSVYSNTAHHRRLSSVCLEQRGKQYLSGGGEKKRRKYFRSKSQT